jgi:molybdenum cofactor biosynthesis enzyme MoaA
MQDKNKPFCNAPWVSIQYGALLKTGGATPCCEWEGRTFKGPISSYYESQWLTDIKEKMMNWDMQSISNTCSACLDIEKLGLKSSRIIYNSENFNIDTGIKVVDYRPSNICNLKCRMCFSTNSSMIAKEEDVVIDFYDTTDITDLDFSNVNQIKIVGGEPSISTEVFDFLTFLIDNGYSKHINLMITTNATNSNKRWMDLISKFKSMYAIISLDGIGPVYEYIRTHANWDSIVKNIEKYIEYDFDIRYQITASMYNIPVVEDWVEWFYDKDADIFPVEGRNYLSMSALPTDIAQEKIEYLRSHNTPISNVILEIIKSSSFDKQSLEQFKKYTSRLDNLRKTNILELSPVFKRIMTHA